MKFVRYSHVKINDRNIIKELLLRRGLFETTEIKLGYKIYVKNNYIKISYMNLKKMFDYFVSNGLSIKNNDPSFS